jgi:histidinol-phosphate/aromatic aminotransferase/cobyric acid decarboxylase-like protein
MEQYVRQVTESKSFLVDQLTQLGLEARNTPLNFILINCRRPGCVVKLLEKEYVFVRDRSYLPQCKGYIRVTVGDSETMRKFLDRFTSLLRKNESCFF